MEAIIIFIVAAALLGVFANRFGCDSRFLTGPDVYFALSTGSDR